jgi:hypothetical protein
MVVKPQCGQHEVAASFKSVVDTDTILELLLSKFSHCD